MSCQLWKAVKSFTPDGLGRRARRLDATQPDATFRTAVLATGSRSALPRGCTSSVDLTRPWWRPCTGNLFLFPPSCRFPGLTLMHPRPKISDNDVNRSSPPYKCMPHNSLFLICRENPTEVGVAHRFLFSLKLKERTQFVAFGLSCRSRAEQSSTRGGQLGSLFTSRCHDRLFSVLLSDSRMNASRRGIFDYGD